MSNYADNTNYPNLKTLQDLKDQPSHPSRSVTHWSTLWSPNRYFWPQQFNIHGPTIQHHPTSENLWKTSDHHPTHGWPWFQPVKSPKGNQWSTSDPPHQPIRIHQGAEEFVDDHRLHDIQLQLPRLRAEGHGDVVACELVNGESAGTTRRWAGCSTVLKCHGIKPPNREANEWALCDRWWVIN